MADRVNKMCFKHIHSTFQSISVQIYQRLMLIDFIFAEIWKDLDRPTPTAFACSTVSWLRVKTHLVRMGHICSHTLLHVHPQLTSKLLPEDIGIKHAYASHHWKSYHMDNCLLLSGSVFFTAWSGDGNFWSGHCFRLALQSFLLSFCWVVSSVNIACYRERPLNIIWQAIVTDDGMISIWVCFICVICLSSLLSRVCVAVATSGVSFHGGGWGWG